MRGIDLQRTLVAGPRLRIAPEHGVGIAEVDVRGRRVGGGGVDRGPEQIDCPGPVAALRLQPSEHPEHSGIADTVPRYRPAQDAARLVGPPGRLERECLRHGCTRATAVANASGGAECHA
ncbi:MAG: hypothetical protein M5U08_17115 [Burkholderiales bacterium]|nr:hypothetical protein [Burkholderiales bacterium]